MAGDVGLQGAEGLSDFTNGALALLEKLEYLQTLRFAQDSKPCGDGFKHGIGKRQRASFTYHGIRSYTLHSSHCPRLRTRFVICSYANR